MDLFQKARTAMKSASMKAERAICDICSDISTDIKFSRSLTTTISKGESWEFPWHPTQPEVDDELKERILELSQKPYLFLFQPPDDAATVEMGYIRLYAETALEMDEELNNVFNYFVPRLLADDDFWKQYFSAVERIKRELSVSSVIEAQESGSLSPGLSSPSSVQFENAKSGFSSPRSDVDGRRWDMLAHSDSGSDMEGDAVGTSPVSSYLLRQLARAIMEAEGQRSMSELAASTSREPWMNLTQAVGKGLARLSSNRVSLGRENPDRFNAMLYSLFDKDSACGASSSSASSSPAPLSSGSSSPSDDHSIRTSSRISFLTRTPPIVYTIHGAPPLGFVTRLATAMASLPNAQKMAALWLEVTKVLKHRFLCGYPVPHVPMDEDPNLRTCLINQHLQLLNGCLLRRKRRLMAAEMLQKEGEADGAEKESSSGGGGGEGETRCASRSFPECDCDFLRIDDEGHEMEGEGRHRDCIRAQFAILADGTRVRRRGVKEQVGNLELLETGDLLFAPLTQDGPLMTEDAMKESEELIIRTGSVGAGCQQLYSDMQAFKAANPGAILEDFVRWYSPPDWSESAPSPSGPSCSDRMGRTEDETSLQARAKQGDSRGHLSARMNAPGNLWMELWNRAMPLEAVRQPPLFDEELAGEASIDLLVDIEPEDFFKQLFVTLLASGLAMAAASSACNSNARVNIDRCIKFVTLVGVSNLTSSKLNRLCQVYEVVEKGLLSPACHFSNLPYRAPKPDDNVSVEEKSRTDFVRNGDATSKDSSLPDHCFSLQSRLDGDWTIL